MASPKIRVLVVDDSVVMRKLITDLVTAAPDLEVAATASGGRSALLKIPLVNPDVITLDVEMGEMDGLATLQEIQRLWPGRPVVMCSSLTERGATITLDALAAGARDYISKPTASAGTRGREVFAEDLVRKLRLHGRQAPARKVLAPTVTVALPRPVTRRPPQRTELIVIGSSTGGPNALATVVGGLPAGLRVPVLIVQHMPPVFTRLLAERLNRISALDVTEAIDGEPLRSGHVYLAPGDRHLMIGGNRRAPCVALGSGEPENSCRPSVDVLFWSAAEVFGGAALAVVLTGMGQDGLRGAEQLRETGAPILVQDEATSVVWGMPGAIAEQGLADEVIPIGEVAGRLWHRVCANDLAARPNLGAAHSKG